MKNKLKYLPYIGVTISLLIPYYQTIMSLALFGDATMHAHRTKLLLEQGLFAVNFNFPPLYNFIQAGLFLLMGEKGLNFIVFIGVVLIVVAIYLLAEVITSNKLTGFIAVLLVLSSPKLMYYSSRMYMEILLSGFVVLSIWALVRYFKSSNLKNVILLSLLVSISALIKQQGLFILLPSTLGALLSYLTFIKSKKRGKVLNHTLIFLIISTVVISPGYYFVFRSNGEIIPGNKDYLAVRVINELGNKISGYKKPARVSNLDSKLEANLSAKWKAKSAQAATLAERRHIKPIDPLTSWADFIKTNSLYVPNLGSREISSSFATSIGAVLIVGYFLYLLQYSGGNKDLYKKMFSLFILIFLVNNYILFARNTDQMRYHLFLPIILSVFIALAPSHLIKFVPKNKFRSIIYSLLLTLLFLKAGTLVSMSANFNSRWNNTQIYTPSIGGTAAIAETGAWLHNNATESDLIWQSCSNELEYYSRRPVFSDFTIYFATEDELLNYVKQKNVKFIVIFESQLVDDESWRNYCWIPQSFSDRVSDNFPLEFVSSYNDIKVFKVL